MFYQGLLGEPRFSPLHQGGMCYVPQSVPRTRREHRPRQHASSSLRTCPHLAPSQSSARHLSRDDVTSFLQHAVRAEQHPPRHPPHSLSHDDVTSFLQHAVREQHPPHHPPHHLSRDDVTSFLQHAVRAEQHPPRHPPHHLSRDNVTSFLQHAVGEHPHHHLRPCSRTPTSTPSHRHGGMTSASGSVREAEADSVRRNILESVVNTALSGSGRSAPEAEALRGIARHLLGSVGSARQVPEVEGHRVPKNVLESIIGTALSGYERSATESEVPRRPHNVLGYVVDNPLSGSERAATESEVLRGLHNILESIIGTALSGSERSSTVSEDQCGPHNILDYVVGTPLSGSERSSTEPEAQRRIHTILDYVVGTALSGSAPRAEAHGSPENILESMIGSALSGSEPSVPVTEVEAHRVVQHLLASACGSRACGPNASQSRVCGPDASKARACGPNASKSRACGPNASQSRACGPNASKSGACGPNACCSRACGPSASRPSHETCPCTNTARTRADNPARTPPTTTTTTSSDAAGPQRKSACSAAKGKPQSGKPEPVPQEAASRRGPHWEQSLFLSGVSPADVSVRYVKTGAVHVHAKAETGAVHVFSVPLPDNVDPRRLACNLRHDGLLTLRAPLTSQPLASQPRRLEDETQQRTASERADHQQQGVVAADVATGTPKRASSQNNDAEEQGKALELKNNHQRDVVVDIVTTTDKPGTSSQNNDQPRRVKQENTEKRETLEPQQQQRYVLAKTAATDTTKKTPQNNDEMRDVKRDETDKTEEDSEETRLNSLARLSEQLLSGVLFNSSRDEGDMVQTHEQQQSLMDSLLAEATGTLPGGLIETLSQLMGQGCSRDPAEKTEQRKSENCSTQEENPEAPDNTQDTEASDNTQDTATSDNTQDTTTSDNTQDTATSDNTQDTEAPDNKGLRESANAECQDSQEDSSRSATLQVSTSVGDFEVITNADALSDDVASNPEEEEILRGDDTVFTSDNNSHASQEPDRPKVAASTDPKSAAVAVEADAATPPVQRNHNDDTQVTCDENSHSSHPTAPDSTDKSDAAVDGDASQDAFSRNAGGDEEELEAADAAPPTTRNHNEEEDEEKEEDEDEDEEEEDEEVLCQTVPLSGFQPEHIRVRVKGRAVSVSARRQTRLDDVDDDSLYTQSVEKRVDLPDHLDPATVRCLYNADGDLLVFASPLAANERHVPVQC